MLHKLNPTDLLPNNISDERKADPLEDVSLLSQVKIETVPHKVCDTDNTQLSGFRFIVSITTGCARGRSDVSVVI